MSEQKEKKGKLVVRTPSMIERGIRNKWLIYGGLAVALIWFAAMAAIGNRQRPPRVDPPEFVDTLPDVRQSDERAFARMQRELRQMRAEQEEQERKYQKELESLRAALQSERKERDELIERTKAEHAKQIAELRKQQEEAKARELAAKFLPGSTDQSASPAQVGSTSFADYIRPPRIGENSGVVPPPPLTRGGNDGAQPPRPNLPQRDSQAPQIASDQANERTEPIVLDSKSGDDDPRMMRGPAAGDAGTDDTASMEGFLPMGSFAEIALLTGADFGAGERTQANPQPVLMRVQADAILPGRARYEMRDCFAIGSGYGELSAERAYVQAARMSCVDRKTGQMLETTIQGYIVDSDGKLGLRGKVSRRSGVVMGKAMIAGFAEGAAQILAAAAGSTTDVITGGGIIRTIDPENLGEIGLYGGAGRAAEILAEQYIKEAENMFPVIEIPPGRRGTLVIQVGQKLEWTPYTPNQKGL